jgi:hypothetical protein
MARQRKMIARTTHHSRATPCPTARCRCQPCAPPAALLTQPALPQNVYDDSERANPTALPAQPGRGRSVERSDAAGCHAAVFVRLHSAPRVCNHTVQPVGARQECESIKDEQATDVHPFRRGGRAKAVRDAPDQMLRLACQAITERGDPLPVRLPFPIECEEQAQHPMHIADQFLRQRKGLATAHRRPARHHSVG